jgi:HSP20 family protein|tara:strand:- start:1700 stop:2068 length:369 start_codon:yes stop_codon:yes gene_type:complete
MLLFKKDPFFNLVGEFLNDHNVSHRESINVLRNVTENEYELEFVLPGLSKEDVNVVVEDNKLKVSYKDEENENSYTRSFDRSYELPEDVNQTKISAKSQDGILKITIPKVKKSSKQRTILIK